MRLCRLLGQVCGHHSNGGRSHVSLFFGFPSANRDPCAMWRKRSSRHIFGFHFDLNKIVTFPFFLA